jgi:hypothetical protein
MVVHVAQSILLSDSVFFELADFLSCPQSESAVVEKMGESASYTSQVLDSLGILSFCEAGVTYRKFPFFFPAYEDYRALFSFNSDLVVLLTNRIYLEVFYFVRYFEEDSFSVKEITLALPSWNKAEIKQVCLHFVELNVLQILEEEGEVFAFAEYFASLLSPSEGLRPWGLYFHHPLTTFFPQCSSEQREVLKSDLLANGLQNPIILLAGQILDGRARYDLCLELGIEPFFEDYSEDSDPFVWLYSVNFLPPPGIKPRTLNKSQLACLAVDGYHQNIFETQKAAYSFFGVQRRLFFFAQQIYSYNKDWFSRIRSGDLSLRKALELQTEETKNLSSLSEGDLISVKPEKRGAPFLAIIHTLGELSFEVQLASGDIISVAKSQVFPIGDYHSVTVTLSSKTLKSLIRSGEGFSGGIEDAVSHFYH